MNARLHYTQMADAAERGISDASLYERIASFERAQQVRRNVLDFALGVAAGIAVLMVMAAL